MVDLAPTATGHGLATAHVLAGGPDDERRLEIAPSALAGAVAELVAAGWRFAMLTGTDERAAAGGFALEAVLHRASDPILRLRAPLPGDEPAYPAVARHVAAALWDERELHDLLGIVPTGHPDLRRLVLHDGFPDGYHPLRHDAPATPPEGVAAQPYRPFVAHGEGVYELPVGPIHAGVIEPGGFRFSVVGESILYLDARLFYTHRGVEKLVEGRSPGAALAVVERSCGVCTVAHATAYAIAVERLCGPAAGPPPRALVLRAVLAELERLYNHVGDLGNICAGIGFNVGSSQLGWLKEQLLRVNEGLTGHRYLMGAIVPGGLAFDVDGDALAALPGRLASLRRDVEADLVIVDRTEAVWDRFRGAGLLRRPLAEQLGTVGVGARASGIATDLRAELPTGAYRGRDIHVATAEAGDVAARFEVRRDEVATSFDLLAALVGELPDGPVRTSIEGPVPAGSALGWAEGPRGASWLLLATDASGNVTRCHLRSASFANWPAVAAAASGNLVPDFPLVNKSFELCYACTDR